MTVALIEFAARAIVGTSDVSSGRLFAVTTNKNGERYWQRDPSHPKKWYPPYAEKKPDDVIRIVCSGAGGWGPAWQRPVEAVLDDIAGGKVSVAAARRDYGVVPGDEAATAALRTAMAKNGPSDFDPGPERRGYESVWTAANYRTLVELLGTLPVHWRFYAKKRIFGLVDAAEHKLGDGTEVRAAFAKLRAEFPQIAA